ncbi:MAG: hypothetical protein GY723_22310, partial [bacterium]|nr:hypothetical protein [bacterium]
MAGIRDRYLGMFFVRRDGPLQLSPEVLRSLQLSLNTPVVRVEAMPVAPARAVLVLYTSSTGGMEVVLSVRSLKTGQVLHFAPGDALPDVASCIDAAMAFGEGMGFLFDDDELAVGNAERAFGIWAELMGEPVSRPPVAASAVPPGPAAEPSFEFVDDDEELEVEEEIELLLVEAIEEGPGEEPIPVAPAEVVPELARESDVLAEGVPELAREPDVPAADAHRATPPPDTGLLTSMVEDALAADQAPGSAEPSHSPQIGTPLTKFRSAPPPPAITPAGDTDENSSHDIPAEDDAPALQVADPDRVATPPESKGRSLRKTALGRLRLVKKRKPASDE